LEATSPGNLTEMNAIPPTGDSDGARIADVRRIAVLRANSIGDFVLALPALAALRSAYPTAEITYLGDAWHPSLLNGRPGPWDRVEVVPRYLGIRGDDPAKRDSGAGRAFFEAQRRRGYDLAVQIHGGGANSNPFVQALGARVSVGLRDTDAPGLDRWIRYRNYQHEVHRFLEVVSLVGAAPVGFEPQLDVVAADREAADDALPASGRFVALHPGANDPRRRWPVESFAAVADELAAHGARIVVVGHGPADAEAASSIARAASCEPLDLVGRLSLGATLAALERCSLLVANDSGPRHLASAVGTPTVGVYWWKNLLNTGPLTARWHRVAVSTRTACPTCGIDQVDDRCLHDSSMVADVPVEVVVAAALDLYMPEAPLHPPGSADSRPREAGKVRGRAGASS
jgi:ADP-heptose:LPS heptosyltransferase